MAKEAKSVTKHRKQKEKMDKPLLSTEVTTFKREKTLIQKAMEYADKKGYKYADDKGILMFVYSPDSKTADEIRSNLLKEFGSEELKKDEEGKKVPVRVIPFTYGFSTNVKNYSIQTVEPVVTTEE